jgi:hypothetical protein
MHAMGWGGDEYIEDCTTFGDVLVLSQTLGFLTSL